MSSVLPRLGSFLSDIGQDQYRPQQKWLRDMLSGLFGGSPLLSDVGRRLGETDDAGNPRRLIHTEKRLSRNLNSDRLDDAALHRRHLERSARLLRADDGEDVVIAVDYTDFSKPRANLQHGMQFVCRCHDGSKGDTGVGYPVVQLEASLPHDRHLPVDSYPYSTEDPSHLSQSHVFLDRIRKAAPYVGARAWWTFDRGFDSTRYFDGMDALKLRWIIRLQVTTKNPRHVRLADGRMGACDDVAMQVPCPWTLDLPRGRGRKAHVLTLRYGIVRVSGLRDGSRGTAGKWSACDRAMVVVHGFGNRPLVLLASEFTGGSRAEALALFNRYRRRWKAEEATRTAKDSRDWGVRLEDLRALKLRGIRRIAYLSLLLYAFLGELRAAGEKVVGVLVRAIGTFGKMPPDVRYRVFRAVGLALDRVQRDVFDRWRNQNVASPA